jgi:F-type H+-transporting ATPase subunit a
MPHGESWLSLLLKGPYGQLLHWVEGFGHGWFFGSHVAVQHLLSILLVSAFLFLFALRARSQLLAAGEDILPEDKLSARTMMELLLDALLKLMQFTMPYEAALKHVWIVGALGCFILFSNLLGLIPGFVPPTENLNTTFACGTFVFIYYNFYAFSKLGMGHLAHIANPVGEWWGWSLAWLLR